MYNYTANKMHEIQKNMPHNIYIYILSLPKVDCELQPLYLHTYTKEFGHTAK
jgi:hypothetical protein